MHGGWCWGAVRGRLTAAGYSVHTPTLTGQGDRRHQLTREVGVSTHVDDLIELLWFEDLTNVHLVLHSYAGVLAGPVVARADGRITAVTYVGAFIGHPGESFFDAEPPEVAERYRTQAATTGDGWRVPVTTDFLDRWGVNEPLRDWIGARLTDFPLRCGTESVEFDPAPLARIPTAYVRHTNPAMGCFETSYEAAVSAGWLTRDIASSHDMMMVDPGHTADLLVEIDNALSP